MKNKLRNIGDGITKQPQNYDGFDTLYNVFRKTINGSSLLPGFYKGRVISVKRNFDPSAFHRFEVMVWIPELHNSIPEPVSYLNITMEQVQGLTFFKPIDSDAEEPCVGLTVNVFIDDPNLITGYYHSISNHKIDVVGRKKIEDSFAEERAASAKKAIEKERTPVTPRDKEQPKFKNATGNPQANDFGQGKNTERKTTEELIKEAKKRDKSLDSLTPEAKEKVEKLIEKLKEENLPFKVHETRRSQIRQKYLYTKSRTTAQCRARGITEFEGRPELPWATSTLNSNHKYGNAVDMVLDLRHPFWKGKTKPRHPWDLSDEFMPLWIRYRQLANGVGLKTFGKDWPHVSVKRG